MNDKVHKQNVKRFAFGKEMGINADKTSTDFLAVRKGQEELLIPFMVLGKKRVPRKNKVAIIEGKEREARRLRKVGGQ